MWVFDMFTKDACNIFGRNNGLESWTWEEYQSKKKELGDSLVLVDMIRHPVKDSVTLSDDLFSGKYPDGTVFALYCHSGWSSGYLQMQLAPQMAHYTFINIKWGIMSL